MSSLSACRRGNDWHCNVRSPISSSQRLICTVGVEQYILPALRQLQQSDFRAQSRASNAQSFTAFLFSESARRLYSYVVLAPSLQLSLAELPKRPYKSPITHSAPSLELLQVPLGVLLKISSLPGQLVNMRFSASLCPQSCRLATT